MPHEKDFDERPLFRRYFDDKRLMFFFPTGGWYGMDVLRPESKEDVEARKKRWKEQGLCPECGEDGEWRPPASLVCKRHGPYAGC